MQIKPRTGQTQIQYYAIIRRCIDWYEALAEEWQISKEEMDGALQTFAWVSVRVTPDDKKQAKLLASGVDTPETVKSKFIAYAQLPWSVLSGWEAALDDADAPAEKDTAPEPPPDPQA